jgi:hypothetical protein
MPRSVRLGGHGTWGFLRSLGGDPLPFLEVVHSYHFGVTATGRNPRQRFWPIGAVFAAVQFASGCHRLRPLGSIDAPSSIARVLGAEREYARACSDASSGAQARFCDDPGTFRGGALLFNFVKGDAAKGPALGEQAAAFLRVSMWGIDADEPQRACPRRPHPHLSRRTRAGVHRPRRACLSGP